MSDYTQFLIKYYEKCCWLQQQIIFYSGKLYDAYSEFEMIVLLVSWIKGCHDRYQMLRRTCRLIDNSSNDKKMKGTRSQFIVNTIYSCFHMQNSGNLKQKPGKGSGSACIMLECSVWRCGCKRSEIQGKFDSGSW